MARDDFDSYKELAKQNRELNKRKQTRKDIDDEKFLRKQQKRAFKFKMRQIEEEDDSWKEWENYK